MANMEYYLLFVILYLSEIMGRNAGIINYGPGLAQLEENNKAYLSNNSYLKFKIGKKQLVQRNAYAFKMLIYPRDVGFHSPFYRIKEYPLPLDKEIFLKTHYEMDSDKSILLPKEIKNHPTNFFIVGCEYLIPIPIGKYNFMLVEYSSGVGKFFLEPYDFSDILEVEKNQTYNAIMSVRDGRVFFESIEKIPTPADIKEIKKCTIDNEAKAK